MELLGWKGVAVVQLLALSPHSKKVVGLSPTRATLSLTLRCSSTPVTEKKNGGVDVALKLVVTKLNSVLKSDYLVLAL